jgi:integrase
MKTKYRAYRSDETRTWIVISGVRTSRGTPVGDRGTVRLISPHPPQIRRDGSVKHDTPSTVRWGQQDIMRVIREAEQAEETAIAAGMAPSDPAVRDLELTFAEFYSRRVAPSRADNSEGTKLNHQNALKIIKAGMGDPKISAITAAHTNRLRAYLVSRTVERTLAVSTARAVRIIYHMIVSEAHQLGLIRTLPRMRSFGSAQQTSGRGKRKLPDEIKKMDAVADTLPIRVRTVYYLMRYCALRVGEAGAVKMSDFVDHEGRPHVHVQRREIKKLGTVEPGCKGSNPAKGKLVTRYVPLPAKLVKLVEAMRAEDRKAKVVALDPYVWSGGDEPGHYDAMRGLYRRIHKSALGTASTNTHALRHTRLSELADDPHVPLRALQTFAGHASITTTQGYMDPSGAAVAALADVAVGD